MNLFDKIAATERSKRTDFVPDTNPVFINADTRQNHHDGLLALLVIGTVLVAVSALHNEPEPAEDWAQVYVVNSARG